MPEEKQLIQPAPVARDENGWWCHPDIPGFGGTEDPAPFKAWAAEQGLELKTWDMTDLIEVKTTELAGEALGWAVGKAEGLELELIGPQYGNPWRVFARYRATAIEHTKRYNPWEDWALAGPLLEKHRVWVHVSGTTWSALISGWVGGEERPTVAICRSIVADKLGDTVQVPKELMP